jgi:hypothetical protein
MRSPVTPPFVYGELPDRWPERRTARFIDGFKQALQPAFALSALGSDLEPRLSRAADDFVGRSGGRKVEIDRRLAEREIAHGSADKSGLLAPSIERFERSRQRAHLERRQIPEFSIRQTREGSHSIRPGTRTPFSTCAGM